MRLPISCLVASRMVESKSTTSKVNCALAHALEGAIKEFQDFRETLFVDIELSKCTNKYILR